MIRRAEYNDVAAMLEIYNDAILNTTSIFVYHALTLEDYIDWFEGKARDGYPVLVYIEDQQVAGFATYGTFRRYSAYKYTIEHSVYVHKDHRRKNIGTKLLQAIREIAEEKGYATMVGAVTSANEASRLLHIDLGFSHAGTIHRAGYKFGKWLDLDFYEYPLKGPETPTDG